MYRLRRIFETGSRLRKQVIRNVWIIALFLGASSGVAFGQTGTITGTVTDSTGAVAPGAAITLTNVNTNAQRTFVTDGTGNYVVPSLAVGAYRIEASLQGFQKAVANDIVLETNETRRVDFSLRPGELSQTVEVTGAAVLVQSETSSVGNVIDSQKVVDLPLNGRRFESLTLLVPGVTTTNPAPSAGAISISASGGRFTSNNFVLDGIDNNDQAGNSFTLRPIVDSIQEFKVQTNSYTAEFGRGGGANIQVTTKSGTNQFHGALWEFIRNDALDARSFFTTTKQAFRRNQFGGAFGGPVMRDRTFFFVAYEGLIRRQGFASLQNVPTLAQRQGDFSALTTTLRDPLTGATFLNNQIPRDRWSPQALNILNNGYPLPTPGLTGASNLLALTKVKEDMHQFSARGDHRFSDANTLSGRLSYGRNDYLNPCTGATNTACIPGYFTVIPTRLWQVAITDIHIISSRLLNEARFGFNIAERPNQALTSSLHENRNVGASLGIPGLPSSTDPEDYGMPTVNVTGLGVIGDQGLQKWHGRTYNLVDVISYVSGNHSIRTGFEYRNQLFSAQIGRARDVLTFDGRFTGNAVADLLLGYLSQTVRNPFDFQRPRTFQTFGGFIQDDWKIRPNLTLNIGIRYDYLTPDVEAQDRFVNVNSITKQVEIANQNGASRALYYPDKKNFAPRFGFAYRPGKDFVIRGGYGIFFDQFAQGAQLGPTRQGPPFFSNQTFNASTNPLDLTLNDPFPAARLNVTNIFDYRSIQTDFKNGYLQQWNFGVQKSLLRNTVLELGYIASKGSRLYRLVDDNQAAPGPGSVQSRRPLPQYGSVWHLLSQSSSSYQAFFSRFERRFGTGLTLLASYTWSHSIDDSSSTGTTPIGQDFRNFRAERGSSDFDTRHRAVFSYLYVLPFGRSRSYGSSWNRGLDLALGGWTVSGITTLQAGNPINLALQGSRSNTGTNNLDRPDATGGDPYAHVSEKTRYLAPLGTGFALQPAGMFGNSGRNPVVGPGIAVTDLSLLKNFQVNERWRVEFRAEAFNIFNRAQFDQPVRFANSPAFGIIQSTRADNRQIQIGLKVLF